MVQKRQIILVDDVDGGEAHETVTFALDGVNYEIDLSDKHAKQLRSNLDKWVKAGRKTATGRGGTRRTTPKRDLTPIREWAAAQGMQVSDRGRVAAHIVKAYDEAH